MNFATYKQYKESDILGLTLIPQHWKVQRIKDNIIRIASGVTPKGGSDVYVDEGIPFLRSQNVHDEGLRLNNVSFITEEINSKMRASQAKAGDIVLNITGASIGRSCIVPDTIKQVNISQHILLLRFKKYRVAYAAKYLQSRFIKDYIDTIQVGASKQALNMGQTLNLPLLLPPQEEQIAMTEYLDHHTAVIDCKIDLLEQKIKLYQTLRKTLINETVCRGINPHTPHKDSGIEWIGEIPAHWQVERGKDLFKEKSQKGYPDEPLLAASQKSGVVLKTMLEQRSMEAQKSFEQFKLVNIGDFVISLRSFEGGIEIAYHRGIISPAYTVFSSQEKEVNKEFYKYLFKSEFFIKKLQTLITGIRDGQAVKFMEVQKIVFPLPPFEEQREIASYLDIKTNAIALIIKNVKAQIATLKELRKTLINDVVTGKLNVTA